MIGKRIKLVNKWGKNKPENTYLVRVTDINNVGIRGHFCVWDEDTDWELSPLSDQIGQFPFHELVKIETNNFIEESA